MFADEPNIPPPLLAMDNVVLLPHVGSATRETRQAMGDLCKANLDAWFARQAAADADSRIALSARRAGRGARRARQSSGAIGAGGVPCGGHSTANSAATTSASAIHSAGPGRSPSTSMPANTPTTGTGSEDIDDTATGSVRASVNHAQCASVPARKML